MVQINPLVRDEIPTSASAIENRVNEISFNSSLMREMRAIAFVKRLIGENRLDTDRYKDLLIHMIDAEAHMRTLGVASKLVDYGADVANLLRGNAKEIRGINVAANQEVLDNQQGGFFGGGFGMVGVNNHPSLISGARAAGSGFLSYQDAMIEIESMTADIRREMTLKYKVQF